MSTLIMNDKGATLIEDYPQEEPTTETVDALLNSEMNNLSLDDRNKVYLDIHGVSNDQIESDEMIEERCGMLDKEIAKIEDKDAYVLAHSLDRNHVLNLRLRFLRSTLFDPKLAAVKMVKFFDVKRDLFGDSKLTKNITQDDLSKNDLEFLHHGYHQFLPVRDSAGRGVFLWAVDNLTELYESSSAEMIVRHKMRVGFYWLMANSEEEEIQKKGIVIIGYSVGNNPVPASKPRQTVWGMAKVLSSIPVRVPGLHCCYNSSVVAAIASIGRLALNTFTRMRVRTHYGSHEHCLKQLQSFGIPTKALPFDEQYQIDIEDHIFNVQKRKEIETGNHGREAREYVVPGPNDVLSGRTKMVRDHPGTVRYRTYIERNQAEYEVTSSFQKTALAYLIMKLITDAGGRFLKFDGDGWLEMDVHSTRQKISHCFRSINARKKQKARKWVKFK